MPLKWTELQRDLASPGCDMISRESHGHRRQPHRGELFSHVFERQDELGKVRGRVDMTIFHWKYHYERHCTSMEALEALPTHCGSFDDSDRTLRGVE
jgi:hypothetical protein